MPFKALINNALRHHLSRGWQPIPAYLGAVEPETPYRLPWNTEL